MGTKLFMIYQIFPLKGPSLRMDLKGARQNCTKFGEDTGTQQISFRLLHFETRVAQRRMESPNFCTFCPLVYR